MNTPTTLAAYAGALVLVFGAAVGVGNAVGPAAPGAAAPQHDGGAHGSGTHADETRGEDAGAPLAPTGLAVSQDGYTLLLEQAPTVAGRAAPLAFRILDEDGETLTDYAVEHDRELHLVVVRRDATGFQHLHPTRNAAGTWTLPLTLASGGTHKVIADFTPTGRERSLALSADLTVAGPVTPGVRPAEVRTAVVDGYTVTLAGELVAGDPSRLTLSVTRDGAAVTDLQPYLGAYGHLVALREGDLAYLHVHPEDGTAGPEIAFTADVPTAGDYRLFLDFRHDDVVRTAALGLRASPVATTTSDEIDGDDETDAPADATHQEGHGP